MSEKVMRPTENRELDVSMLGIARRRARARDEGTIAVMAALIIPVVLLVLAVALASLVWGTSETEAQRASDQAALESAASALLVPSTGVSVAPVFPTINTVLPQTVTLPLGLASITASLSQNITSCKTVGNAYSAVSGLASNPLINNPLVGPLLGFTTGALNSTLSTLNPSLAAALTSSSGPACSPITIVPDAQVSTVANACAIASAAMVPGKAPWSNNFYGGNDSDVVPSCANGRVTAALSDEENNLLALGGTNASIPGAGTVGVNTVFNTAQTALGTLGVRLQTSLPNSLCPKVTVSVRQPVKGPLFSKVSQPNGLSTAKRIVKNAVIVPVFNGAGFTSPTANPAITGTITTPPINLNPTVLGPLQNTLVGTLDALDTAINQRLANQSVNVGGLGANVGQLDLLSCLRDTVADLYNPPTSSGAAPTSQQILNQALAEAYQTGDPIQVIQVGVRNCAGAVSALSIYGGCIAPALGTAASTVTGLYDVPFLDVTPVIVNQVANGNFQGVPVSATQASGAFRSVLVRSSTDDRAGS